MKKSKKSDLSIYDAPFSIDDFIFSTPLTIRKIRLSKEGFTPIIARLKTDGIWQGLSNVSANHDERWSDYPKGFVEKYLENLPEDVALEELMKV